MTKSNCVAVRPCGEQLEVNDQSETQVNSIRPETVASLPKSGEAQTREGATILRGRPGELKGNVQRGDNPLVKRCRGREGDWSRNGWKCWYVKQGDLSRIKRAVFMRP